jgi:hypothetical protein
VKSVKLIALSAVLVGVFSLVGCGDSNDSDVNSNDSDVSGGNINFSPITPLTDETTYQNGAYSITVKVGAEGNFKAGTPNNYPVVGFAENVNEIEIAQLIYHMAVDSKKEGSANIVTDLKAGTQTIEGSHPEYGSVKCVNTYDVELPMTIYSVIDLLIFDLDSKYQRIDTTCPDWVNDDEDEDDEDEDLYAREGIINVTVTETSGTISKISHYSLIE